MIYSTLRFGEIDVTPEQEIRLTRGLLGFDELTHFALLPHQGKAGLFTWLQSLERPEVAFVLCAPATFLPDYNPSITEEMSEELSIGQNDSISIFTLVTFREGGRQATTNLCGPLIINTSKRIARQFILDETRYPLRHQLFCQDSTGPSSGG